MKFMAKVDGKGLNLPSLPRTRPSFFSLLAKAPVMANIFCSSCACGVTAHWIGYVWLKTPWKPEIPTFLLQLSFLISKLIRNSSEDSARE